jgi:hypothetical protein
MKPVLATYFTKRVTMGSYANAFRWPGPPADLVPKARLVFNQPKFLPITTVSPPPSQVVRSTPLGIPCSELQ